jgi:quercetin dioxygenase-like cupin family protein
MGLQPRKPTSQGLSEWFTGHVEIETIVEIGDLSPVNIAAVHFSPGARTAWHSHEGGQTLYVTEGRGFVRTRGEAAVAIRAGDVHVTADGVEHWHGATRDQLMTHFSITQGSATWGEHVTDVDYGG